MPVLLLGSPLKKTWLGRHYWKPPSIMDLPVELEYIPYQEFEDRFSRLNEVAHAVYPTVWPNVFVFIIFSALFATAAVGITRSGSGLAIMGQGACFILPVLAVLWIRVRKETKAKARKKFKQRSQKLLRTWTAQDSVTHAMQWKLRLRDKSTAKRWRGRGIFRGRQILSMDANAATTARTAEDAIVIRVEHHDDRHSTAVQGQTSQEQQQQAQQQQASLVAPHTHVPALAVPRQTADVYSALRTLPRIQRPDTQLQPPLTQLPTTDSSAAPEVAARSKLEPWIELFRDLYCCACVFREGKVWMIEISIREGILDEYALPVPSPVYCDYRLPGYEDVVAGRMTATGQGAGTMNVGTMATSTLASAPPVAHQPRYFGSPPAYESNSENDSGSDDDNDDDDDDEGDVERGIGRVGTDSAGEDGGPRNQRDSIVIATIGHMESSGSGLASVDRNRHRGMEMTAVLVSSGPAVSTEQQRSLQQQQQQQQTGPVRTMISMSTLSSMSTSTSGTSLHAMLRDKEEEGELTVASANRRTGDKED
ncbi:hypothetical protein BGZ72_008222 [Mortierella alpina]|nr:hypothetical protein BGZ72_008222 [Mortierella alpina]